MSRKTILIVDDDAIILLALKQELRLRFGEACVYETALSGARGLERIAAIAAAGDELSLVVSDWLMPGMNGDEFLTKVHGLAPAARLVMLTAHADEADMERLAREIRIEAFLRKPWNPERLFALVDSSLARISHNLDKE